jgi:hypothetical protein
LEVKKGKKKNGVVKYKDKFHPTTGYEGPEGA